MSPPPTLSSLFVYPIKSLAGVALTESSVSPDGLGNDRRLMLVETDGRFITQRSEPSLARLRLSMKPEALVVTRPEDEDFLTISLGPAEGPEMRTQVFGRFVTARRVNHAIEWSPQPIRRPVNAAGSLSPSLRGIVDSRSRCILAST